MGRYVGLLSSCRNPAFLLRCPPSFRKPAAAHLTNSFERIRRVVSKIPRGRVMTYGDVARAAGMPGAARTVGYAMRALGRDVPWQRVVGRKNARTGQITIR